MLGSILGTMLACTLGGTARADEPESPRDPPAATAPSAPPPAAPAQGQEPAARRDAALREYEERYVVLDDFTWVQGDHHRVSTTLRTIPFQGKYRRPLAGDSFYEAVGHPELASIFRERESKRHWLVGGGIALVVGGALYALVQSSQPEPDLLAGPDAFRRQMEANDRARTNALIVGIALGTGGLVLASVGMNMDPHPVDASGARRLADEHNRRLRRDLGLPPEDGSPSSTPPASGPADGAPRIGLGIGPTAGGAMALVAVSF